MPKIARTNPIINCIVIYSTFTHIISRKYGLVNVTSLTYNVLIFLYFPVGPLNEVWRAGASEPNFLKTIPLPFPREGGRGIG
jgi:hypothetical protein